MFDSKTLARIIVDMNTLRADEEALRTRRETLQEAFLNAIAEISDEGGFPVSAQGLHDLI
jgi:hypothetical protein